MTAVGRWDNIEVPEPEPATSPAFTADETPDLAGWAAPVDWATFWASETPDQEWLIEPILPAHRQVAIFSRAKTGKSLLALDAAAALATGRPLLGATPGAPPRDVVYLDLEMTEADVRERLEDLGYGPEHDLSHFHYYLLPSLPSLDTELGGQVVDAIAARYGAEMVVVDTMARAVKGDENESDTYRDFYRYTGYRLKARGVALLRLDHGGKDLTQGQRGSSGKNDDVDVVFMLSAGDEGLTLKRTHSRIPWVPATVQLQRHGEPLRHTLTTGLWPDGTKDVAQLLDEHHVPLDARTADAMRTLAGSGEGRRRQVVIAALKWRRQTA